jgi:uncharacterized heparinase superfamily protein
MRPAALDRVGLYLRTVRHLRSDQLAALVYRRVRPKSAPHRRLGSVRVRPHRPLRVPLAHASAGSRSDVLAFVGREKKIDHGIDWRCPEMSRLWRYHLHYFDFLRDEHRSDAWKRATFGDWIERNPRGTADAWDPYPVSLRIVNWIKYFDRLEPDALEGRWLESLYEQVLWLENNLERHVLANHYLKNAKALAFAGIFFAGADAERWRAVGFELLDSESREQFLDDGGHFERSPMYHLIALEDLLDVLNQLGGDATLTSAEIAGALRRRARGGLDFLEAILMPDGRIPLFNDAAFGVGPTPEELFDYADAIVDYRRVAPPEALSAHALAASGYYVIRHGGDMLVIDCGPPGPSYQPGHGHCDCLSYELVLGGERIVVDTGVHDYEAGPARRYARSTAAHSTVVVDGEDQSEIWGVFRVGRRAAPLSPSLTKISSDEACFVGAHDGYLRLPKGVIHRRTVRYVSGVWSFEDRLEGRGRHRVQSRVHLHPDLVARTTADAVALYGRDGRLRATLSSPSTALEIETAPVYQSFGTSQDSNVITMSSEVDLPATLSYAIIPAGVQRLR